MPRRRPFYIQIVSQTVDAELTQNEPRNWMVVKNRQIHGCSIEFERTGRIKVTWYIRALDGDRRRDLEVAVAR